MMTSDSSNPGTLKPHPRLLIGRKETGRLHDISSPMLKSASEVVRGSALDFAKGTDFTYDETHHNAHLVRARIQQGRIITLLVEYLRTGDRRFRDAVLDHVRAMGRWQYWSWIAWRDGDSRPDAIFDLSYGENCATLALAYDLLFGTLTDEEKRAFIAIVRPRPVAAFLAHAGHDAWWFRCARSNWNTVCAGGAGLLALAMYEELSEAPRMLELAEESIVPYMQSLEETGGGWQEGIGYWNYGFRYAFTYLLSHQRATGQRHPLMKSRAVRKTLRFPLDFTPGGAFCSFGDVNSWAPAPFHFAAAENLKCKEVLTALRRRVSDTRYARHPQGWGVPAEMLLFYPREEPLECTEQRHVRRLYKGQDWGLLADVMPNPRLALTVRGGTTDVPHGHLDLMSFHCAVDGEAMLSNITNREYLDTTFSPRRWDLFEMMPLAKNTLLINGVGIANPSTVKTRTVNMGDLRGIRIDGSDAMGDSRNSKAVTFCGRLFLLLDGPAALIVDSVVLPYFGRVEARMHTEKQVEFGGQKAVVKGEHARLQIAYASTTPASLWSAASAPTTPAPGISMLRWCTDGLVLQTVFATVMAPGNTRVAVTASTDNKGIAVTTKVNDKETVLRLTPKLNRLQEKKHSGPMTL